MHSTAIAGGYSCRQVKPNAIFGPEDAVPNAIAVNQNSFSLRVGSIYQLHTFISMVCQLYHLAADVGDIKHGLLNRPKQVPATEHHGFYEIIQS